MTREELAISLGYKNAEEWDKKLSDPKYQAELSMQVSYLALCYALGSGNMTQEMYDAKIKTLNEKYATR